MSVVKFPTYERNEMVRRLLASMFEADPDLAFKSLVLLVKDEGLLVQGGRSLILHAIGKAAATLAIPLPDVEAIGVAVAREIAASR